MTENTTPPENTGAPTPNYQAPTQGNVTPPGNQPDSPATNTVAPPTPTTGALAGISARLNQQAVGDKGTTESGMVPVSALPFDPTKLSSAQLRQLKSMLAVTPDDLVAEKGGLRHTLRKINGKYVVEIGGTYQTYIEDPELRAKVLKHMIKFRLDGKKYEQAEWEEMLYEEFMYAERVACEEVSVRTEVEYKKEGLVRSKENGLMVERQSKIVKYFYTVKLPEGRTIEVPGTVVNA